MALVDTGKAIGMVTQLLVDRLGDKTKLPITVGRPEPSTNGASTRLNLFLYEAQFDPNLKNVSLDEGQVAPLWLVLKYIITAFDNGGNSDTTGAYENLGQGIRSLQELNFLSLRSTTNPDILKAIEDNPEPLKITFDEMPLDLLSKLMQGSDEKYRFSMGFQVRPVMIAPSQPPSYSLLVGVDYTASPLDLIGENGIRIPVIPSMGSSITEISPLKFEANSTVTIKGKDLHLSGLIVKLGQAELAVTSQQPNMLKCVVNGSIANGNIISAGSHTISVVQILPTGRRRSSNLVVGGLLPRLNTVATSNLLLTTVTPAEPVQKIFGDIDMSGVLLGGENDDIFVALYQEGKVIKLFDGPDKLTTTPDQSSLTLAIPDKDAVLPGLYRIILRVNGQQAKNSPEVTLS